MADPTSLMEEIPEPDISQLVIEDDEPLDNLYSERQQALLSESLYASWRPGRDYVAMVNVGLFYAIDKPPYVPDLLLSMDVLPGNPTEKRHRTYLMWVYGKRPDLVIEIVSNVDRHEERMLEGYANIGIPYYVIHDPYQHLSDRVLRAYVLHGGTYVELVQPWFEQLGLGLFLWEGSYRGYEATLLRWRDAEGRMLLTGAERADQLEVEKERLRAENEALRARLQDLGLES